MKKREGFTIAEYVIFTVLLLAAMLLCICLGSVSIPLRETFKVIINAIKNTTEGGSFESILLPVRIPRVFCVALAGASLSLSGAAMQGLLKNPLADGSTLGVSSGASLGAVISIAFGITIPEIPFSGTMVMAIIFAFLSLLLILAFAYRLDSTLSTNTIILIGVVFSMFASSLFSLVITFAGEKVKSITFWTLGSLRGSSYRNALVLLIALIIFGGLLLSRADELNAFAIGEDNARSIGVNVFRTRVLVLISISVLIGVCVSIGGTIGFVGLVTPHILRRIMGPNHRKLLPASLFSGAIFLLLSDLVSRVILRPRELPVGVITSLIGTVVFIWIFFSSRRRADG